MSSVEQTRFPREVWILAAISFFVALGYGIVAPAVPGFAREFGVGRTLAALVISMFAVARITTLFGGAKLVDRFGGQRVLTAGLLIVAVSSALAGLSQTYWQLLVLRGAGGLGSAMFSISSASVLARAVPSQVRGRAMSVYSGGFLIGGIAGPVVGGPLTELSLRAPFFFYAGTLAVAALISHIVLPGVHVADPDPPQTPDRAAALQEGARVALRDRLFRAATVANFCNAWTMAVRTATVPLFVTEALLAGPAMTGIALAVFAASNALCLPLAGRASDRWGRRPAMVLGASLSAVGLLLMAFTTSLPLLFVAMVVGGAGASLQVVGPAAVAGDFAGGRKGSVLAAFQMAGDVGVIVGPVLVNFTVDQLSFTAGFLLSAGIAVLAAAFALFSREPVTRDS